MATMNRDPVEDIIADGRLCTRPLKHYGLPTVLTVDLEALHATLVTKLRTIFVNDRIVERYLGSYDEAVNQLNSDITAMADYLIGQTYNRLRGILLNTAPHICVARMNKRCPVPKNMEFPTWISSTLSLIGPLRVSDGPVDALFVYASSSATMNNYGRANPIIFNVGHYSCLTGILRDIGVALAPFDHTGQTGSAFPTIDIELKKRTSNLYGTIHQSHYESEDIPRIAFCTAENGVTPFQSIGITIGYVDDEATITALAAAPENIPADQTANSTGRPLGGYFNVNYLGISRATAAVGTIPARPAGAYIIGRGMEKYWHCILASGISACEILEVIRFRLTRSS